MGLQDSTGTQFYVVQDQLGSVRGLVRRDGTWIMSQRFTPAGQLLARDSVGGHQWPKGLHVGWTGRETDPETGLSFHRARYYSPELRRWTQEDPIGYGGGGNLYAYVGGAVLEGRDPSGLFAEVGDLGLGFAEQETFSGGGELSMCLVFCTDARDRDEQKWEEWFDEQAEQVWERNRQAQQGRGPNLNTGDQNLDNAKLRAMIDDNLENAPDVYWNGQAGYRAEVGGWCTKRECTRIVGTKDGVDIGPPPTGALFAYHSHPNVGLASGPGGARYSAAPSACDRSTGNGDMCAYYIRGRTQNTYVFSDNQIARVTRQFGFRPRGGDVFQRWHP
ncbi:MAG: RHS repeat-associated core domain-containing protein [Gemmatimonadetes bacterium]|nr:RHS repeat-associated core domain-containing protein [Gemmatimonadota bacterium]